MRSYSYLFYLFIFNLWVKTVLIKVRNSTLVLEKCYYILCNELCTLISFSIVHLIFLGIAWRTLLFKYFSNLYYLYFWYKPAFDYAWIVDALSFLCALLLWKWACCPFFFCFVLTGKRNNWPSSWVKVILCILGFIMSTMNLNYCRPLQLYVVFWSYQGVENTFIMYF